MIRLLWGNGNKFRDWALQWGFYSEQLDQKAIIQGKKIDNRDTRKARKKEAKAQRKLASKARAAERARKLRQRKENIRIDQVTNRLKAIGVEPPSRAYLRGLIDLFSEDLELERLVDQVAMKLGVDEQLLSLIAETWSKDADQTTQRWKQGFVLVRSGKAVALVCPSHASVGARARIRGAFCEPGEHWTTLWNQLGVEPSVSGASAGAAKHPSALAALADGQGSGPILDLVDRVSKREFEAALEASVRLRQDRSVALPIPAFVENQSLSIRFDPISVGGRAPIVPFLFEEADEGAVQGVIYLASPENPIPIGVLDGSEDLWGRVAVTCLSAYADLTCLEISASEQSRESSPAREGASITKKRASGSKSQRVRSAPARKSTTVWSGSLRVVGHNPLARSSIVIGHIRRLGKGREASAEATRKAQEIGITLNKGETWVSPHIRGQAEIGELRFEWNREMAADK